MEEDGFDDMEALLGIESVDMDAIGMRTGHKRKLLRAIRELDRTPRYDAGSAVGSGLGQEEESKRHRDSMAQKLKLDLRGASAGGRRGSSMSRRSLYSDDRSAASHRSGRLIPSGDGSGRGSGSVAGSMTSSKMEDDDGIEMELETLFVINDLLFTILL